MAPANAKPGLLLSLKSSLERYASTAAPTRDSKQHLVVYLIVFAVLGFIIINRGNLYLRRRRMKKEHGCKPCPHVFNKDPIFGLDVLRSNLRNAKNRAALEGNRQRYINFKSNTFHSRIITGPVITTIEPENVKTILSLRFKDYSIGSRQTAFSPLLGNGIFNADGVRWANSRHLLRPNFARDQVADLDSLERHFKLMLKFIPKDGTTVDLQELFFRLTMDTATEFLFNHSTNSLRMMGQDDGTNEDVIFAKAFNFAQEDVVTRTRFGFFYRFLNDKKQGERAINICHAYIDKWVDDAVQFHNQREKTAESSAKKADSSKANGEERYVFIHELAKQTSDKKRIRDELINILLAGRDTTASLLSNMFFEIAKRPEIWKKLQEEVATLDGRMPTYEELRNLKYVKWCLNESLRMHPVVPANSRYAIRDTVLPVGGGPNGQDSLFVPAGTVVAYSPYAMHRRTDIYGADADIYRPERWEHLRPGWEYLPFNGGPRICLGQQYALTEASFVTVRLVQEFKRCESRDDGPWEEGLTLTCCSANGTKVGMYVD